MCRLSSTDLLTETRNTVYSVYGLSHIDHVVQCQKMTIEEGADHSHEFRAQLIVEALYSLYLANVVQHSS